MSPVTATAAPIPTPIKIGFTAELAGFADSMALACAFQAGPSFSEPGSLGTRERRVRGLAGLGLMPESGLRSAIDAVFAIVGARLHPTCQTAVSLNWRQVWPSSGYQRGALPASACAGAKSLAARELYNRAMIAADMRSSGASATDSPASLTTRGMP